MPFIDELRKTISDAGQETVAKAKNFADIAKLNDAINTIQQQITRLYLDFGEAYYDRHKDDEVFAEDAERMTAIRDAYAKIARYKEQINQIKGVEICPSCGAEIPAGSAFCSSCGAKVVKPEPAPREGKFCPQCHASVGENDLFCMSCGAKLSIIEGNKEV